MPRGGVLPGGLRPGEGRQPFCPSEACSTTNAARDEYGGVLLGGVLLERAGALEDSQDEYSWDEYRSEAYWLGGMLLERHAPGRHVPRPACCLRRRTAWEEYS